MDMCERIIIALLIGIYAHGTEAPGCRSSFDAEPSAAFQQIIDGMRDPVGVLVSNFPETIDTGFFFRKESVSFEVPFGKCVAVREKAARSHRLFGPEHVGIDHDFAFI